MKTVNFDELFNVNTDCAFGFVALICELDVGEEKKFDFVTIRKIEDDVFRVEVDHDTFSQEITEYGRE